MYHTPRRPKLQFYDVIFSLAIIRLLGHWHLRSISCVYVSVFAFCALKLWVAIIMSPAQGALSDDAVWRLSGVCCVHPRSAGCRVLADWARPAWLKAARFCCRPGRGHIVAAARLQLVIVVSFSTIYRWYRSRGLIAKQTKKDGWLKAGSTSLSNDSCSKMALNLCRAIENSWQRNCRS